MKPVVMLDSGLVGVLTNPTPTAKVLAMDLWLAAMLMANRRVILPEIADYEVRRELIRANKLKSLLLLDQLAMRIEYLPINTSAMRRAAELWAQARLGGYQTAGNTALDGDVILAAQASTLGVAVIVATDNVAHLSRYVPSQDWQSVTP